jgi:hypothetical protein
MYSRLRLIAMAINGSLRFLRAASSPCAAIHIHIHIHIEAIQDVCYRIAVYLARGVGRRWGIAMAGG